MPCHIHPFQFMPETPLRSAGERSATGLHGLALAVCLGLSACSSHRPAASGRSETAERLSEQARQARDRGDPLSAEQLLAAAVERNPGDCETRLELSELLLANGNAESAAANLTRLISQNPDDPRGYVGLAEVLYFQQNLDEAERLLQRGLELDPRQTRGLLLLGKIEYARRRDAQALADFYQVLACDPDHVEAKMLIAAIHLQQGDSRLAAPLLRSIIDGGEQAGPQRGPAQWLLGQCYLRDQRWSDAARALGAGIASRRGSPEDWDQLANACWRAGDFAGADSAVAQALRLAPADRQALALRAALDGRLRTAGYVEYPQSQHAETSAVTSPPDEGRQPE